MSLSEERGGAAGLGGRGIFADVCEGVLPLRQVVAYPQIVAVGRCEHQSVLPDTGHVVRENTLREEQEPLFSCVAQVARGQTLENLETR